MAHQWPAAIILADFLCGPSLTMVFTSFRLPGEFVLAPINILPGEVIGNSEVFIAKIRILCYAPFCYQDPAYP